MPEAPKPPALVLGWHWPTPGQVIAWLTSLAALLVQSPDVVPAVTWEHLPPGSRLVVMAIAFLLLVQARGLGSPSAQQAGRVLAEEAERRASVVPTTPAAEARERFRTQRGDVPTTVPRQRPSTPTPPEPDDADVDQEAPTRPGGGT